MKIHEINIYPIKSLGGVSLEKSVVEEKGLRDDRRLMLVDEKGDFLTQRTFGKMAQMRVSFSENALVVAAPKGDSVEIPKHLEMTGQMRVKVWSSSLKADVYGAEINEWFSEKLGKKCFLVKMPADAKRIVSPFYAVRKYTDTVSFADGYPILLIGTASLDDLNAKLSADIPMNRFRPNLTIETDAPFIEDTWRKIKIGETVLHLVKPCARCVMVTIDQQTGVSDGVEPLKTLAAFRLVKGRNGTKINFGQNVIAENFGAEISAGDAVEVLETK